MRLVDRVDGLWFSSALDKSIADAADERDAARWETAMLTRISTKIIVAVGSVALIIIGIFSYGILDAHKRHLINEVRRSAYQLSETVKNSTHYDMLLNRRVSVHRIINSIGKQEGIKKVRIFNKEGAVIYSTDPHDAGQMVDKRGEECYACHAADRPLERLPIVERTRIFQLPGSGRILGIINPIYNEPSCWQGACHAHEPTQKVLGVLDISMSLDDVDHDMESSQRRLMLFGVVAIGAVSLMIYCLINRIVLRPVNEIVAAMRKVAAGDLHHKIVVARQDEIGALAESFNDMTRKLSEAQRQIYQSEKLAAVGQLAAGVAHEINNPLTGVLSYASFLLKRAEDKPEFKADLDVIVRETKRCRQIVKGLLDFARQMPPEKQACDLTEIVERAAQIVQVQLLAHRVELRKQLRADLPRVNVDANQIQQVLVNFLLNANDAIGDGGGTITLVTDCASAESSRADRPREVEIRLSDTGCGITAANIERIFDPFFSTKGRKGTGLGLAVAWGIIEKHNGRIEVQSEVGKGTTFRVLLPIPEG
jgi:two-component system, NtrC family, sensor kinase